MKKSLSIFTIIISLLYVSCVNDDDVPTTPEPEPTPIFAEIDAVTGLDFFDDNGAPVGLWRTPNDRPGVARAFPNPNLGTVSILSMKNVDRVWIVPADCVTDTISENIPSLSQSLSFEISELDTVHIKDITFTEASLQFNLDLSDLTAGFYKIFYQIEETQEIFWQNIYTDPMANSFPTFETLDNLCN